ncbi:MAG: TCR/Tet family MFS transporter [Sphingomonadaceae bacterium]|nr:TCR/Tet family MFS transporter [Sphingomonadaceae bacterium]
MRLNEAAVTGSAHRHALAFIFVTVLIDVIGLGIIIPVLPKLVMALAHVGVGAAARIGGYLMFAYSAMQFVCGPVLGGLSDRFGRRPILLGSLAAFGVDYALMGFAPTLAWLFAGRIIAGIAGASFNSAYAYIADVTPPERRTQDFGLLGFAFGIGFIVGPALGGFLAVYGTRTPFFVAAGLAVANVVYGYFAVPESLALADRRPFDWRRANVWGSLVRLRQLRPAVLLLASATFLWSFAQMSLQSTWTYYTLARFGWSLREVGWSLAAVGVSAIFAQAVLTRILVPRFGERRLIVWGVASTVSSYIIYAGATVSWVMYVGIAVGTLGGLVYPALQSLMSGEVGRDEQGELQGAVSSLVSLAAIVGPLVMTQAFATFSAPAAPVHLPGAAFVIAAVLATGTFVLFRRAKPVRSDPSGPEPR